MKITFLLTLSLLGVTVAQGQTNNSTEHVQITLKEGEIDARTDEKGVLHLSISPGRCSQVRTTRLCSLQ